MIYAPHRFCFIHVPRTGGNSICSAVATTCVGRDIDVLIATNDTVEASPTGNSGGKAWTKRHTRAAILAERIPDWDHIYKFAFVRPVPEIIESQVRLAEREQLKGDFHLHCEKWVNALVAADKHKHFTDEWNDEWEGSTDFYTHGFHGEDLGVELFQFSELNERWPEICEKARIPYSKLPHLNK